MQISVGDRLEGVRVMLRLEQQDIIKVLNITKYTYMQIKHNKKSLPLDMVVKLKDAYGVSPDFLCFGVGEVFLKGKLW